MYIYKIQQRCYLTLIEMIVVMTIIMFVGGIAGINISKAIQEQRFRTEVALVVDQLRLAQNLMLILNEDVKVKFKHTDKGITHFLSFQCASNSGWDKELTRPSKPLTAIRQIEFQSPDKKQGVADVTLSFLSKGMVMSQGILKLSTGPSYNYQETRYICLYGYPSPITAQADKSRLPCLFENEMRKTEQLTQYVMPEIIRQHQALKQNTLQQHATP
ncbi:MAG: pilus assembly FimT family protein [Parachlamydiaceae bacterium]